MEIFTLDLKTVTIELSLVCQCYVPYKAVRS